MIFLGDFENTHDSGFEGYHYLTEQDNLVEYYIDENSALQKGPCKNGEAFKTA